jgi:hypothetical protein
VPATMTPARAKAETRKRLCPMDRRYARPSRLASEALTHAGARISPVSDVAIVVPRGIPFPR